MSNSGRIAGIELGGTKAVALLWQDGAIVERLRIPTRSPEATLQDLEHALDRWWRAGPFDGLGIASFGPLTLDRSAPDYGCIRTTPKPGWSGTSILPRLARRFTCPTAIETDVNAAALAEHRWGGGLGASCLVYLTLGTGVGGGILVEGHALHGRLHPEIGHLRLRRQPGDAFQGLCPFHGDCVEGLLSGPALQARFGAMPTDVPADDPRWSVVVADLAELAAVLIHGVAPNRLLIGGGVGMGAPWLTDRLPARLAALLGAYYPDLDEAALAALVTRPVLGDDAGPLGAVAVGLAALGRGHPAEPAPCLPD